MSAGVLAMAVPAGALAGGISPTDLEAGTGSSAISLPDEASQRESDAPSAQPRQRAS